MQTHKRNLKLTHTYCFICFTFAQ